MIDLSPAGITPLATSLACAGGPGTPKPGTAPLVSFSIGAVSAILGAMTDGVSALAIAVLFAGLSFDAGSFCQDGDVGDPGMTVDDWANALDYANPLTNVPAVLKAKQWFQHVIYPILCDCNDGTAPPPAVVTAPPALDTSPHTPPALLGPNCWSQDGTKFQSEPNGPLNWNDELPNIPPSQPSQVGFQVGIQTPLPTSASWTVTVGTEGANPLAVQGQLNFFTVGGTFIQGQGISFVSQAPGTTVTRTVPFPATAVNWNLGTENNVGGQSVATNSVKSTLTIYCTGQSPTSINTPCCPPDPSMDMRLAAIMDMLQQLLSLQPLGGPYQDTIRHSNLTGNGIITINPASSAIRVEVKNDLTNWPRHPQIPDYYFSLGFITPFAVGAPLRGQRLIYQHQTFTWPSYTDQIAYALEPSVQVDLVEQTRGA